MSFSVAVIGCGNIAQVHLGVLSAMSNIHICACVDIRFDRAQQAAQKYGCNAYHTIEELFEKEQPDAVHLCVPHHLHAELASYAAQKGAAVFCEKPPAITRTEWTAMKAIQSPVGVCFQNRYNPNVMLAEQMISQGQLGQVLGVRGLVCWKRDEKYYSDDWHGTRAREGGGALINQAVHTLDLVVRFLGGCDAAEAKMSNHHLKGCIEVEDTAEVYIRCGQKTGLLYATTAWVADAPIEVEIVLEKGLLRIQNDTLTIIQEGNRQTITCPEDEKTGKSYWGAGHKKCIMDFYQSLEQHCPYRNGLLSCEHTMDALLSAYEQNPEFSAMIP